MIVVTGGAGFIGSNLVLGLNRRGITDILVVDDLENGEKHLGLSGLEFADFVDYRDYLDVLDRHVSGETRAVFHLGACSDTMEADGRYMMRANYEYSKTLLDACRGQCPFIYASSASVYGDGSRGFREDPACEEPLNVYAFSKFLFDRWVRRVAAPSTTPSQVVGLRYFNVYGPQENHKGRMASVVFKFHEQLQQGGELEVFEGSEGFLRDFVYVEDAVDMNLWFLDNPEVSGIFNCGTGRTASFLDLANAVVAHNAGARVKEVPFPDSLKGKYQAFTQADLSARRAAGDTHEFRGGVKGVADYVAILKATGGYHRGGGA
jgi:ADP-L-glycero-D-manno-heptose 6-epimerase